MAEKKRLLVLASTYPRWPDDPEPGFVHELSKRLTDAFEVTVLCPHAVGAKTQEYMDGVDVRRYHYAPPPLETLVNNGGINGNLKKSPWKWLLVPGFLLSQWWHTVRLIRRLKPDVVHAHWIFPQALIAAVSNGLQKPVPVVVTSHGSDLYMMRGAFWRPIRWLISRRISALSVVGEAMQPVAATFFPSADIHVMPMGVDLRGRFSLRDGTERIKGLILYVGRLVESKGLGFLIKAFAEVKKQLPTARLEIVGHGPDEELFREMMRDNGLEDCVYFRGALPNAVLPEIYASCDLFVAPFEKTADGKQEGLGLVLLEAVGSGCQVLTGQTDVSASLGVETVDIRDFSSFAARVLAMLAEPDGVRMVRNAKIRENLIDTYDWNVAADRYRQLFDSLA